MVQWQHRLESYLVSTLPSDRIQLVIRDQRYLCDLYERPNVNLSLKAAITKRTIIFLDKVELSISTIIIVRVYSKKHCQSICMKRTSKN